MDHPPTPLRATKRLDLEGKVRPFPAGHLSDADLARLAARGDGEAMGAIWDRYAARVRRLLWHLLGNERDLDDLVQDVFLELVDRLATLRDPAALRGFVFAVATNRGRSELRRRRVRRIIGLTSTGDLPELRDSTTGEGSQLVVSALHALLAQLGDRDRSLFLLRFVDGLEHADVAVALGISVRTAKRDAERIRTRVAKLALETPGLAPHLGVTSPEKEAL